jgi:hypothetical protein
MFVTTFAAGLSCVLFAYPLVLVQVSEIKISSIEMIQLSRFHLKMGTKSILWNMLNKKKDNG